jgi:hypothetical protein
VSRGHLQHGPSSPGQGASPLTSPSASSSGLTGRPTHAVSSQHQQMATSSGEGHNGGVWPAVAVHPVQAGAAAGAGPHKRNPTSQPHTAMWELCEDNTGVQTISAADGENAVDHFGAGTTTPGETADVRAFGDDIWATLPVRGADGVRESPMGAVLPSQGSGSREMETPRRGALPDQDRGSNGAWQTPTVVLPDLALGAHGPGPPPSEDWYYAPGDMNQAGEGPGESRAVQASSGLSDQATGPRMDARPGGAVPVSRGLPDQGRGPGEAAEPGRLGRMMTSLPNQAAGPGVGPRAIGSGQLPAGLPNQAGGPGVGPRAGGSGEVPPGSPNQAAGSGVGPTTGGSDQASPGLPNQAAGSGMGPRAGGSDQAPPGLPNQAAGSGVTLPPPAERADATLAVEFLEGQVR